MKKYAYTIDDLNGFSYETAIKNIHNVLDNNIGLEKLNFREDCLGYHSIAKELHLRFDSNGEII